MNTAEERPRLSVVVACRNAEAFLEGQLAALARQQCPVPWELLICDNGSTDGTVALAASWSDRLPLRIIDASAVLGAGPSRNAGVEVARGEWIGFCDADDEVGDGWLEALCAGLTEHPFVAGRFDGQRLNSARTLRSRQLDQQTGLQHSSNIVGLPHAGAGNMGIHRSLFLGVGGFDPSVRYLQDTDLCWRVQLAGYPLVFVSDLLVHIRLRSTLRTMYRQGRNYGASQAVLERRHAPAARRAQIPTEQLVRTPIVVGDGRGGASGSPSSGDDIEIVHGTSDPVHVLASTGPHSPWRAAKGALRLVQHFVSSRSSIGAQAWQVGWHLGYRSEAGRRS